MRGLLNCEECNMCPHDCNNCILTENCPCEQNRKECFIESFEEE